MENIVINNKQYRFAIDYSNVKKIRNSFNQLTQETFGFNFEKWHIEGYWRDRYIPYSILDGEKVVANVSVNIIDFVLNQEKTRFIQLGTFMTHHGL